MSPPPVKDPVLIFSCFPRFRLPILQHPTQKSEGGRRRRRQRSVGMNTQGLRRKFLLGGWVLLCCSFFNVMLKYVSWKPIKALCVPPNSLSYHSTFIGRSVNDFINIHFAILIICLSWRFSWDTFFFSLDSKQHLEVSGLPKHLNRYFKI